MTKSCIDKIPQKKTTVTKGFVEKWAIKLSGYYNPRDLIKQMLKELNIEIIKK